jgi:hypothetical protein
MAVIPLDIQQIIYLYTINFISVNDIGMDFLLKVAFLALWTESKVTAWRSAAPQPVLSSPPARVLSLIYLARVL